MTGGLAEAVFERVRGRREVTPQDMRERSEPSRIARETVEFQWNSAVLYVVFVFFLFFLYGRVEDRIGITTRRW